MARPGTRRSPTVVRSPTAHSWSCHFVVRASPRRVDRGRRATCQSPLLRRGAGGTGKAAANEEWVRGSAARLAAWSWTRCA